MSAETRFKEICEADPTLLGYLEGGIYTFTELGRAGLVSNNPVCAEAFDLQNGMPVIRPCMVIRVRNDDPDYERHDTDTQQTSHVGNAGFWIYQDSGYTIIDNAATRLYRLFNSRTYSGLGLVRSVQNLLGLIAPEFDNTSLGRCDYQFKYIKGI